MIPEIDADYARRAMAAKRQARRDNTALHCVELAGLLAGVGIAGVWIVLDPSASALVDGRRIALLGVAGLVVAALWGVGRASRNGARAPACPRCGHDWTIREGKGVPMAEQMLTWDRCPGCGALMNDDLLARALTRDAQRKPQQEKP